MKKKFLTPYLGCLVVCSSVCSLNTKDAALLDLHISAHIPFFAVERISILLEIIVSELWSEVIAKIDMVWL